MTPEILWPFIVEVYFSFIYDYEHEPALILKDGPQNVCGRLHGGFSIEKNFVRDVGIYLSSYGAQAFLQIFIRKRISRLGFQTTMC